MLVYLKTIGILGGGQLAKMLSEAAATFHFRTICIDANEEASASAVTQVIKAKLDDFVALENFAKQCDVITFENENIPAETIRFLKQFCPVYPDEHVLSVTQDRLLEKELFTTLNIPTNEFIAIHSLEALEHAAEKMDFPCLVKTRRFGYDGKGQYLIKNKMDIRLAWQALSKHPLLLESFVELETEVSLIATRNPLGKIVYYPLTENFHQQGILRLSQAPFFRPALEKEARDYMEKILTHFNYVGTLAIEFFVSNDHLLANEIAPRVHNSGHWTIEGAVTSQFENHVRAIAGLPLGNTEAIGYSAMINCLGSLPELEKILAINYAHYHVYGKSERPDRKIGHVTVNSPTKGVTKQQMEYVMAVMKNP